jgi:hypothetical protein
MHQDAKDALAMMQCLLVGISPGLIEAAKNNDPPMNVLFEVGTDRTAKAVHISHLKKYRSVLVAVGGHFRDRVPTKVICRDALQQLDDRYEHKLSHARMRKVRGVLVANKTDVHSWSKENADALSRLMQWSWRLLSRTRNSKDADVQAIKDAWKSGTPGVKVADTGDVEEDDEQGEDEQEEQEEEDDKEDEEDAGSDNEAGGTDDAAEPSLPASTLDLVRAAAALSEATHIPPMLVSLAFSTLACICKLRRCIKASWEVDGNHDLW